MSNQSPQNDKPAGWVMPEPVFRTSEGHTPKTSRDRYAEDEADTLETETSESDAGNSRSDIGEPQTPPAQAAKKEKLGCFRSFLFILLLIGLLGAAIVAVVLYLISTLLAPAANTF